MGYVADLALLQNQRSIGDSFWSVYGVLLTKLRIKAVVSSKPLLYATSKFFWETICTPVHVHLLLVWLREKKWEDNSHPTKNTWRNLLYPKTGKTHQRQGKIWKVFNQIPIEVFLIFPVPPPAIQTVVICYAIDEWTRNVYTVFSLVGSLLSKWISYFVHSYPNPVYCNGEQGLTQTFCLIV